MLPVLYVLGLPWPHLIFLSSLAKVIFMFMIEHISNIWHGIRTVIYNGKYVVYEVWCMIYSTVHDR